MEGANNKMNDNTVFRNVFDQKCYRKKIIVCNIRYKHTHTHRHVEAFNRTTRVLCVRLALLDSGSA